MGIDSISCSDLKNLWFEVISANFEGEPPHFFPTVADHVAGEERCFYSTGAPVICSEVTAPDLDCVGRPCQPFSRQRTKRHQPGSVQPALVDWFISSQGFELPGLKRSPNQTTPPDRSAPCRGVLNKDFRYKVEPNINTKNIYVSCFIFKIILLIAALRL